MYTQTVHKMRNIYLNSRVHKMKKWRAHEMDIIS